VLSLDGVIPSERVTILGVATRDCATLPTDCAAGVAALDMLATVPAAPCEIGASCGTAFALDATAAVPDATVLVALDAIAAAALAAFAIGLPSAGAARSAACVLTACTIPGAAGATPFTRFTGAAAFAKGAAVATVPLVTFIAAAAVAGAAFETLDTADWAIEATGALVMLWTIGTAARVVPMVGTVAVAAFARNEPVVETLCDTPEASESIGFTSAGAALVSGSCAAVCALATAPDTGDGSCDTTLAIGLETVLIACGTTVVAPVVTVFATAPATDWATMRVD
jgi:hypothetical protein